MPFAEHEEIYRGCNISISVWEHTLAQSGAITAPFYTAVIVVSIHEGDQTSDRRFTPEDQFSDSESCLQASKIRARGFIDKQK
jgi:hypothetical protein